MANHKSARKVIKVIAKRTLINKMRKSMARTAVKKLLEVIKFGDKENAMMAFRKAESCLHKCVSKGVMHKNAAARKISRLNTRVKLLMTA
ncbi:30S ribosomal protein S20 [Wolbachia endosymbiont of Pentidionis agamae]|uniref:30S ribosomal protein S20 n=1 Tax=Wolbachia endosymbiont of Pentidionis agamae TaxID=3110435 RepID=UPI002FD68BF1